MWIVRIALGRPYTFIVLGLPILILANFKAVSAGSNGNTVLSLPANALLFRAKGLRVALFQDGHAQLPPITVGRDFGSSLEVLTGLKAGDKVILNPSDSLTNGEEIKETPPVKEPAR